MDPSLAPALDAPLADVDDRASRAPSLRPHRRRRPRRGVREAGGLGVPVRPGVHARETEAFLEAQIDAYDSWGVACWLAAERATGRVVGYVGISVPTFYPAILPTVEVGWRFDPDVWGHGYTTEGAGAALDQAFGPLGLDRVCSLPQSDNTASVRVAERLGMGHERTVELHGTERRGPVRVAEFWISADEWRATSEDT